ncbi:zinc finger protein 594-like [Ahaetulla prasina]|uniref:zinc finger protein 594-like n=1 Tax=Ahaetulla prasina TaxID=499056 RepID=UPI002649EA66|nr:zinc finger protein 594-like [Ahaetulla prasina]XP_058036859.1 zinc finger protein 594-like [Ahaetulla prasina]XP_058036860.1 zinc finger protein 594-like [Ahaetulla prasina]XP_058036861.1 zinc finger protein 594-like [Ahaetulla prasina]XP_058036862.1 zinc finger protein 594-like [Ahaetulla prasina]XP_058036863.1 zinc finger protein 594-like [Ahaetulla prasina]
MAALESAFGEEAMADINPYLDRENLAATECSEFQFNTNSLTGQSQLCILEPHITEIIDNEGLVTDPLTTAEKVALEDSVKTEAVREYSWQSDKVVTSLSVPHQDENLSVKDEEAKRQSSKQINYHNNQNKNLYFCERLKKDFQQPSLFAQHKNMFCASKVPMQSKQHNCEQLQICNPLVPDQNSQTKNCLIGDQCGKNNQSLSHLFQYKNVFPNEKSAWQHQNSQSEASSLISEACYRSTFVPVPLQEGNIIENDDEAVGPNPIQVTDQRTETKNLHICDQCGKEYQWLSELIQHQLLFFGGEADRCQLHMEGRNPSHLAPVPILFQEKSMCATSWEPFQQQSGNHNTHAKMRSSLLKWHTLPREEPTRQTEPKINKSSTLSFVPHVRGNVFADSCEISNLNSKIPIEQKNYDKNLYTCNCDRNDFQCHCLLAKQHLHVPMGGEADAQDQFKIQAGNLSEFQMESKVIESSETVQPQSNLKTNQDFYIKSLRIYKECGKDFRWSSALPQHQVVHSGKVNGKQCPSKVDDQNDSSPGLMDFDQPSHLKTNQLTEKNKHYACGHCGKSFKWPSDLARHKHVHSRKELMRGKDTKPNKSYTCDQCGKHFYWPFHLAQHKHTHSRSKLMRGTKFKSCICGHCGKSYHWPSQLARHVQTHFRTKLIKSKCTKLKKSYICGQCGKNFQWLELAQHKCTNSRKKLWRGKGTKLNKYYTRSQYERSFRSLPQLAQLEHTHSRSKLVSSKCAKLNKSCICDQCGRGFMYPSDLAQHERTHSRKKILRGKCTKLKKYYTCSQHRKSFQGPSQLAEHEHTHSRIKLVRGQYTKLKKSCICDQCGKGFKWPSDLARHKQTHSRKKILRDKGSKLHKYYTRSQCEKSFQWPPQSAQHEHTRSRSKLVRGKCSKLKLIKSCVCDQCGKGFKWPSDLARHEQTHSRKKILRDKGTKLYKYYTRSQCEKSFQWPPQSAQHEHTRSRSKLVRGKCSKLIKSFICDQCGKGFKWPSDLARHERTHSRKKKILRQMHQTQ